MIYGTRMPAWAASVTRGKYPTFVRSSISARKTNSRPQISLLGHRYTGPDCSDRVCVSGIDPLYTDDTTAQVTHTTVRFKSSDASALSGQCTCAKIMFEKENLCRQHEKNKRMKLTRRNIRRFLQRSRDLCWSTRRHIRRFRPSQE